MKVRETLQLVLDIFPDRVVTATIIFSSCWEHYRVYKDFVADTAVVATSSMENNENLFYLV